MVRLFHLHYSRGNKKSGNTTAKLSIPDFRQQMNETQQVDTANPQALENQLQSKTLDNAKIQQQIAEALKQQPAVMAALNSPKFRKLQQAVRELQQANMAKIQNQWAEAMARVNSQKLSEQIQQAERAFQQVNSAKFQKQMAEAQKNLQEALGTLKKQDQANKTSNSSHP